MAANYGDYCNYLQSNNTFADFKNNHQYCGILEHVSKELGDMYLSLIETEFDIPFEYISGFVTINDTYGNPKKESFYSNKYRIMLECSPTSLRYIYHALIILQYYQTVQLTEIVEIGCGYGGLCLAINYFADLLQVQIDKYHMIDLPDVCNLITHYLTKHESIVKIPFEMYESSTFGQGSKGAQPLTSSEKLSTTIASDNLFLISNYCFTEIDHEYRNNYCMNLLPKVKHGFMVWQTCFFPSLSTNILQKNDVKIEEERPQTCLHTNNVNYFVYF